MMTIITGFMLHNRQITASNFLLFYRQCLRFPEISRIRLMGGRLLSTETIIVPSLSSDR